MRKINLITIHFIVFLKFGIPICAQAQETMNYPTLYPSPRGSYNTLKLDPHSANLSTPCTIGTIYTNASNKLQYCVNDGTGLGKWVDNAGSVWQQASGVIYPAEPGLNIKLAVGISAPDLEFHIDNGGILAFGGTETSFPAGAGTKLFWNPNKNAFRAGTINGTQWDDGQVGTRSTVIGGENNTSTGTNSSIIGGKDNSITVDNSFIGGGFTNTVRSVGSSILGGRSNTVADNDVLVVPAYNFIGAGKANTTDNISSAVVAGELNRAIHNYTFVGAGNENDADSPGAAILAGNHNNILESAANSAMNAFIAAGENNQADGVGSSIGVGTSNRTTKNYAFVAAGNSNSALSRSSAIMAGQNNTVNDALTPGQAFYSFIGAGQNNSVDGRASSIAAGNTNQVTKSFSFIGAGTNNINAGRSSAIVAGANNRIDAGPGNSFYSYIGAGENNTLDGNNSSIVAGTNNIINANSSFIGAGVSNQVLNNNSAVAAGKNNINDGINAFIGAGENNQILSNALNASIPGGQLNRVEADDAWAGGRNIRVISGDTFAWGHYNVLTTINAPDAFVIATGNVGIGHSNPTHMLHLGGGAYSDGATWVNGSSRESKENIKPLESADAFQTLNSLHPIKFYYKTDKKEEYLGFIAEDVPDLVAINGRKGLNPIEFTAVLTKVMQENEQKIEDQKKRIKALQEKLRNF